MGSCEWCDAPATLRCTGCRQVFFCGAECQKKAWKDGGHKVICKELPKAIATAEALIDSRSVDSFTRDEFGDLSEEQEALQMCSIAMDMNIEDACSPKKTNVLICARKMKLLICALENFPLSTEAWSMLGSYYRRDLPAEKRDYAKAVKMYDNAIRSACKMHPDWGDQDGLEWGLVEARSYFQAVCFRAFALKGTGDTTGAIREGKKLINWDPCDNQAMRMPLCSWMLEAGDTEGCLDLIQKFGVDCETALAYSHVFLQFLRWKKDEVPEEEVQKALYTALNNNLYVPDLLLRETIEEKKFDDLDAGGPKEACSYAQDAHMVWKKQPDALEWLASQKYDQGKKVPSESDLIGMLRGETYIFVHCKNIALDGGDEKVSTVRATQKRDNCMGSTFPDFHWPKELDGGYSPGGPIHLCHYDFGEQDVDMEDYWRKTTYLDIEEVPFWKILIGCRTTSND